MNFLTNIYSKISNTSVYDTAVFKNAKENTDQSELIKLFDSEVKKYKSINRKDRNGKTILMYAVQGNNIQAIKLLLSSTADLTTKKQRYYVSINEMDNNGHTALDMAISNSNNKIKDLLLNFSRKRLELMQNTKIGYHQTSMDTTDILKKEKGIYPFMAGSQGMAGPGIYFANSESETFGKALSRGGAIFKCNLHMGNMYIIRSEDDLIEFRFKYGIQDKDGSADVIYQKLKKNGYDSVWMISNRIDFLKTGDEYVMYNTQQVIPTEIRYLNNNSVRAYKLQQGGQKKKNKKIKNKKIKSGNSDENDNSDDRDEGVSSSPLYNAIINENENEIRDILLDDDDKNIINQRIDLNSTVLMISCYRKLFNIVKLLIENDADINLTDDSNQDALFYAIKGGDKEIIEYLLENTNISINRTDIYDKYAIEYFNDNINDDDYRIILLHKMIEFVKKNYESNKEESLKTLNGIFRFFIKTMTYNTELEKELSDLISFMKKEGSDNEELEAMEVIEINIEDNDNKERLTDSNI